MLNTFSIDGRTKIHRLLRHVGEHITNFCCIFYAYKMSASAKDSKQRDNLTNRRISTIAPQLLRSTISSINIRDTVEYGFPDSDEDSEFQEVYLQHQISTVWMYLASFATPLVQESSARIAPIDI